MDVSILNQSDCPLFGLPTELRLQIYEMALCLSIDVDTLELGLHIPKNHLALVQTCRRIHDEADRLFWPLYRFEYTPRLFRLRPTTREALTAITMTTSRAELAYRAASHIAESLPNIRSLHIQRPMSVRSIDVNEWRLRAMQMRVALAAMRKLENFEILTPEYGGVLTAVEETRWLKLQEVDDSLRAVVDALLRSRQQPSSERVEEECCDNVAAVESLHL